MFTALPSRKKHTCRRLVCEGTEQGSEQKYNDFCGENISHNATEEIL